MKIRVLVVDDENAFADALTERLRGKGLQVEAVYGSKDAIERVAAEPFDVVILDMVMPGMDGFQTLEAIKQSRPLVEVILLTGFGTLESAVTSLERGAFYYLMKPAEMRELLENILGAYKRKAEHEDRIRQAEIKRLQLIMNEEI